MPKNSPTTAPIVAATVPSEQTSAAVSIGIVVPVFDEAESLSALVEGLVETARDNDLHLRQIVMVDDGSTDESWERIQALSAADERVSGLRLRRNFGKSIALDVGIRSCHTDIVVTMDADLQDDPRELPRFVASIAEGWDVVSGWKRIRHDPVSKTLPSKLFNRVTALASGVEIHDFNCGYKAYRREVFDRVRLYGELHRYVPVLAHFAGFTVTEIEVTHHARRFGRSKFGARRLIKGFLDLLTVMTITRFAQRPGHLFGGLGLVALALGGGILTYLTGLKLVTGAEIGGRPLLLFGVMLAIMALQLLLFGMLAELINNRVGHGPSRDNVGDVVGEQAGDGAGRAPSSAPHQ